MANSHDTDSKIKRASKVDPLRLLVGVETDAEIARRAGVVPETVRIYRIRHGIPSAREAEAARGPGERVASPPPAEGKRPRGRPRKVVAEIGNSSPIPGPTPGPTPAPGPALTADGAVKPRRAGVASPIDPFAHLLGTMPDTALAEQLGVTRGAVYQYRRHRNIAAFADNEGGPRRRGRPPGSGKAASKSETAPAPALVGDATAPSARRAPSAGRSYAYVVATSRGAEERSYVVIGADIVDACQKALTALGSGARILSVAQHLEAL